VPRLRLALARLEAKAPARNLHQQSRGLMLIHANGAQFAPSAVMNHGSDTSRNNTPCPRCAFGHMVVLKSMLAHTSVLWFQCDRCDHLFAQSPGAIPLEAQPKDSDAIRRRA
jgi:hypothetical protein